VELAAVMVVPAQRELAMLQESQSYELRQTTLAPSEISQPFYSSLMPILGNDVLRTWGERVQKLGVQSLWLAPTAYDGKADNPALVEFARQGIERLLMIKLKSYAEMDLADLLLFHCQTRNSVTEVHDSRGQLGVCLLNHAALRTPEDKRESSNLSTDSGGIPYAFRGYAKRILSARERQELVADALTRTCAMRPLGKEVRNQVWIGEGVRLASSARIIGPAYIGARTTVRAGATIGPFASVECDCLVDCGTTVERSTVLPYTYLAPGLLIRKALVDGSYLENLDSGAVADLQAGRLASRMPRPESAQKSVNETGTDIPSREEDGWAVAPPSAAWRKVRL
jgi:carbonic anhydrase/acetyltransferase-like protein (isoleucine patch superfamily)